MLTSFRFVVAGPNVSPQRKLVVPILDKQKRAMKNLSVACSGKTADAFLSGLFGLCELFSKVIWKLLKKTAAIEIAKGGVDADVDDRGEEDDVFGDHPSEDVHGEAGDVQLDLAFYSLRVMTT